MKHLPVLLVLGFALSLCNLTNKLKPSSNSGSPGKGDSDIQAEKATPTGAQTAALAGGQTVKWDRQGMSWTVPPKWTETENESKMSISPMDESFPADISIKSYYDSAKTRAKNGEVDEVKWLEIDGLKGVEFREINPEKADDFRRLQWLAYRKYNGQLQFVNVMLSSNGTGFTQHQDEMYGVLYSTKLVH